MKPRVLVTGGCGFIGSHLVDRSIAAGFETLTVDILFHGDNRNVTHLGDRLTLKQVDICDRASLDRVFQDFRPSHVYHLAAHHFIPYCNDNPVEAIETNLVGTQNVADACLRYGVERLFFASTAAVYGSSSQNHKESECPDPMDIYGVTKAAGEKIVLFAAKQSGLMVRIGRYFNAVGKRETNPHIIPEIVSQLRVNPLGPLVLGNILPKRDYIHADDLAAASLHLLNAGDSQCDIVNIGSGSEYSVEELVGFFSAALARPLEIECDRTKVRKNDRLHLVADTSKLNGEYGWHPARSLQKAIDELTTELETPNKEVAETRLLA